METIWYKKVLSPGVSLFNFECIFWRNEPIPVRVGSGVGWQFSKICNEVPFLKLCQSRHSAIYYLMFLDLFTYIIFSL